MQESWETKFGQRRVRHEPPSIVEALEAASDMSSDSEQQIEIAAALLGADVANVRAVAQAQAKNAGRARQVIPRLAAASPRQAAAPRRAVIVEQKRPRRFVVAG